LDIRKLCEWGVGLSVVCIAIHAFGQKAIDGQTINLGEAAANQTLATYIAGSTTKPSPGQFNYFSVKTRQTNGTGWGTSAEYRMRIRRRNYGGILFSDTPTNSTLYFARQYRPEPRPMEAVPVSAVTIDDLYSTSNGQSGLELSNASGILVEGKNLLLESNGGNGLWVHSSSGNQFLGLSAYTNKQEGIYVGEADASGKRDKAEDARPLSSPKTSNTVSQHNVFIGGVMLQNDDSGIVIGAGDSANIVTDMVGFENTDKDAEDKNENCTLNTWTQNLFSTVSPSCIQ
jgi:hypothetical protein